MRRTTVLDSDALIKFAKAGLLGMITEAWRCLVPEEVYTEVVVRGLEEAHPDAAEIARWFGAGLERIRMRRRVPHLRLDPGLGRGERAAAALLLHMDADFVVTDDRAFLRELRRLRLPHLTTALAVVELVRSGAVRVEEARSALDRMQPMIRQDQYEAARADLDELAKRGG